MKNPIRMEFLVLMANLLQSLYIWEICYLSYSKETIESQSWNVFPKNCGSREVDLLLTQLTKSPLAISAISERDGTNIRHAFVNIGSVTSYRRTIGVILLPGKPSRLFKIRDYLACNHSEAHGEVARQFAYDVREIRVAIAERETAGASACLVRA